MLVFLRSTFLSLLFLLWRPVRTVKQRRPSPIETAIGLNSTPVPQILCHQQRSSHQNCGFRQPPAPLQGPAKLSAILFGGQLNVSTESIVSSSHRWSQEAGSPEPGARGCLRVWAEFAWPLGPAESRGALSSLLRNGCSWVCTRHEVTS